ncbi:MAG: hydrogenase formation protein HypD [Deltaproteobacteria bacterium]|nr:hydrogenase formation protein HypD [Deltaproteobacteria bacterium]
MGQVESENPTDSRQLLDRISSWKGRSLTFMEVCGTHTMAAARSGLHAVLPESIRLISGPGCPVCVTPVGYVDHAIALARIPEVTIATFGDLVRVPGSVDDGSVSAPPTLANARAEGADVRVVYSPLDALALARRDRQRQVVFLGVGFETTAPTLAASILQAADEGLDNLSLLSAAKTIPEAMEVLASSDELALDGFLCPGHVSIILGSDVYRPVAEKYGLACAIAGFEPVEILQGIAALIDQIENDKARVDNCYAGAVTKNGNEKARATMYRAFKPSDSTWRGIGTIPGSGLDIREAYSQHDATRRFDVAVPSPMEPKGCRCGDILRGVIDPTDCGLFGTKCTPDAPRGACMVSSEGSCAARYHYTTGATS